MLLRDEGNLNPESFLNLLQRRFEDSEDLMDYPTLKWIENPSLIPTHNPSLILYSDCR